MDSQRFDNVKNCLFHFVDIARNKLVGYNFVHLGNNKSNQSENEIFQDRYRSLERLLIWFQKIILWHEPLKSAITITGILSTFLIVSQYELRLITGVLLGVFFYNLIKVWFEHIWPEIRVPPGNGEEFDKWTHLHPQILTINELNEYKRKIISLIHLKTLLLIELRSKNPVKFCFITCSALAITASLGHLFSDFSILFASVVITLIAPGIYIYLLPNAAKSRFNNILFNAQPVSGLNNQDLFEKDHISGYLPGQETLSTTDQDINKDIESKQCLTGMDKETDNKSIELLSDKSIATNSSSSSDRLNSDESLIDLDEEQQDGFIIL